MGSYEAKTHLPRLLEEVAGGETITITITKHGVPIAFLSPADRGTPDARKDTVEGLRAFRRQHPLGDITIRDLIDEGRR